jgi:hypothetical protein
MTSSYLKNESYKYDLNTERKLREYILNTIKSFRKNRQLSNVTNVSRRYNPRSDSEDSSSNEEEGSDDLSDLWVNTNHIDEDVSDEDVSDEDVTDTKRSGTNFVEKEKARGRRNSVITSLAKKAKNARVAREKARIEREEKDRLEREDRIAKENARIAEKARLEREDRIAKENARIAKEKTRIEREEAREEADRALLDYKLNFWKTDEFKKWLIEHNRLLKHYRSERSLYSAIVSTFVPGKFSEFQDIDIWENLLDENFMYNLDLDYSESFTRLYLRYRDDRRITRPGYNKSGEKELLFIHMYLKEAFFARHELRNIDFRKKLCLLGDVSRLEALYFTRDKKSYIRTHRFYKAYGDNSDDSSMFDTPQDPELLRKELNIATGYDQILQEVMEMILLAHARNISTPLTTTGFASQLLTLNSKHLQRLHKKLQTILIDE